VYNYYIKNNNSISPSDECENLDIDNKKWRLPSIFELMNLPENAQINYTIFPNMPISIGSKHYKPSRYSTNFIARYLSNNFSGLHYWTLLTGYSSSTYSIEKLPIQCISGNELLETITWNGKMVNRRFYTRNSQDIETTIQTLVFEKCDVLSTTTDCNNTSYSTYTWLEALNYCNTLTLDNRKWRLPNKNELFNLISIHGSYGGSNYTSADFYSIIPNLYKELTSSYNNQKYYENHIYWTSTTDPSDTLRAYYINLQDGNINSTLKTNKNSLRCVTDL
jgi:hypothetical protein